MSEGREEARFLRLLRLARLLCGVAGSDGVSDGSTARRHDCDAASHSSSYDAPLLSTPPPPEDATLRLPVELSQACCGLTAYAPSWSAVSSFCSGQMMTRF